MFSKTWMLVAAAGAAWMSGGVLAQETGVQPSDVQTTPPVPMEIKVKGAEGAKVEGDTAGAEGLLGALEKADESLRTLTADVMYDKRFDIGGDRQVRWGKLYFSDNKGAGDARVRKFAVNFERLRIGERLENEPKVYIFDGQWLVEKLPTQKQFIKRQIVGDGQKFDPLKIGEGPMPIPIGQRKDETLARFTAVLLAAEDGLTAPEGEDDAPFKLLREHVSGTQQIRLVPKPGTEEARDFREVRLWYKRVEKAEGSGGAGYLPILARTVSRAEDISLVRLTNVSMNGEIDAKVLDTTPPGDDWRVDIRARSPGARGQEK